MTDATGGDMTMIRATATRAVQVAATLVLFIPLEAAAQPQPDPKLTEIWEPVPRVVRPGVAAAAPSDAIVLFDGTSLSEWRHEDGSPARWRVADGAFTVVAGTGGIFTTRAFGDVQLHIEWRSPAPVDGRGQDRGNSGVFFQRQYEVQVLDSHDNPTYVNGQAASVYKQHIPLVNASRPPGEWQSYDIVFRAPRFAADGSALTPAYLTVFHNGVLVQDRAEVKGITVNRGAPYYERHDPKLPLMLQDHASPVSFRNVWIREL
jgi:hypothetical protein